MVIISQRKFMASRTCVYTWAGLGFLFLIDSLAHYIMKDWFLVPLDIIFAVSNSCIVFRLLNYPVIELYDDYLSLIHIPVFKAKIIPYRDILTIDKKGSS